MGRNQDGHLTIRCTSEQAERIRKAASKSKRSLTEFLLQSALEACEKLEHPAHLFRIDGSNDKKHGHPIDAVATGTLGAGLQGRIGG